MIYGLGINQHNSFVFATDVTQQYPVTNSSTSVEYTRLVLTGDEWGKTKLATLSFFQIQLYDVAYFNRLTLNDDNLKGLIN